MSPLLLLALVTTEVLNRICSHFLKKPFNFPDGGRYHIETSPFDLRSKSMDWFLYDNALRQERVNGKLLFLCSVYLVSSGSFKNIL